MKNIVRISGKIADLCVLRSDDEAIQKYCEWMSDERYIHFLEGGYYVLNAEREKRYISECLLEKDNKFVFNILSHEEGDIVGNCSIAIHNRTNGEVGIVIGEEKCRGVGMGKQVLFLLLRFGFDELRLHRMRLTVSTDNESAIRCYTKVGFIRFATEHEVLWHDGKWRDVDFMEVTEQRWNEIKESEEYKYYV